MRARTTARRPVAGREAGGECGPAARGAPSPGAHPRNQSPPPVPPPPPPTANPPEPPATGGAGAETVKPPPRSKRREALGGRRGTAGGPAATPPHSPPSPPQPTLSAQISATTKRGCRPWAGSSWGPGNRGADLLLPPPPPTEMGPDRKQAQHPPPPRMPSHPHCRPSHGDPGPSGSGRRATSMLGSGTRMVTQQVVLLSHASEQVDPSTTLPPPPPACAPDGRGARSRRPQGLKSGGCEGLTA